MAFREPWIAYQAASNIEAHLVCDQLNQAGIEAMVIEDVANAGVWEGLVAQALKPRVWIERSDAERAAPVVAHFEERLIARLDTEGADVLVECDECHGRSRFPEAMRGLVETCPMCGAYVDVEPVEGTGPRSITDEEPEPDSDADSAGFAKAADVARPSDNPYSSPEHEPKKHREKAVADIAASQKPVPLAVFLITFRGRANRLTWWQFHLAFFVLLICLNNGLAELLPDWGPYALTIFMMWTSLVVSVKRLHDQDASGWWVLANGFPGVGTVIFLAMAGIVAGTPGPNRFGPPVGGFSKAVAAR